MSRLLTRAVRLIKFGAVAGAAVGVGRLILRRRRLSEATESSWPTIAETAAQNDQPVDEAADSADGTEEADSAGDAEADADSAADADGDDGASDDDR